MDWQIRLAIVIVGALLIAYIFYDYKQKKKRRLENERLKRQFSQDLDQVDAAGFDITGVSTPRKVSVDDETSDDTIETDSEVRISNPLADKKLESKASKTSNKKEPIVSVEQIELGESIEDYILERSIPKTKKIVSKAESSKAEAQADPELILTLFLQADEGKVYQGSDFVPLLLSQGLVHGDMEIFHKYANKETSLDGAQNTRLYSLANAINPGTFDLTSIENIATPALVIFICLPGPEEPLEAYQNMVATLELLQQQLGGKLLDENRSSYTQQTHNHRIELIKDFINKKR